MAGIFAVATTGNCNDSQGSARRLASAMVLFPWQRAITCTAAGGRVHLGAVANSHDDELLGRHLHRCGDLACVVHGQMARAVGSAEADRFIAQGALAEAACAAYRAFGTGFAPHLEGQYAAVLCDEAAGRLFVASSRDGFAPLYLARAGDVRLYGSSLGPLAACGPAPRSLDAQGVGVFLTYGQLFGRQTLVNGITTLDAATVLELDLTTNSVRRTRYWDFSRLATPETGRPLEPQVSELCEVIEAAAERCCRRRGRYVSGLSGGLDSRLVTGLAARKVADLKTWTFGNPDSVDVRVARQVCEQLGLEQLVFPLRPEEVADNAELFAATADGAVACNHAFSLQRCRDLRTHGDIVLNGLAGDFILGGSLAGPKAAHVRAWLSHRAGRGPRVAHPWLEHLRTDDEISRYLGRIYGKRGRLAPLVARPAAPLHEMVLDDLGRNLSAVPFGYRAEQWIYQQRVRRWTNMGIVSDRHFFADGSLFYDYDLVDRCFAVPPRWRRGRRAYIRVMQRLLPDLVTIDYGNTGLPADTPAWRVTATKIARRAGARLLGGGGARFVPTTGTDFNDWARTTLREFYGDLVASSSTRGRSFWDGEAVKALYESHQSGAVDCGHELGLVGTVELFCRRWIDRPDRQDRNEP
jgi:asparagine synthase (glutamine-hydrolysing)